MSRRVPACLLGLPAPWNRLARYSTDDIVDVEQARATAVSTMDRALEGAAALPFFAPAEFPEYLTMGWGLLSGGFTMDMPTFEDFDLKPITSAVRKQDPVVENDLIERYAVTLLREWAEGVAGSAQRWIFESLRDDPDPEIFEALRKVLQRHWRAHSGFAKSMFWYLAWLDHAKTRPLMRRVASDPQVPSELFERISIVFKPDPLSLVPEPWKRIDPSASEAIPDGPNARARALEALDRLIESTDDLPEIDDSEPPAFLRDEWPVWNRRVEAAMLRPTFGQFDLESIAEVFEC